MINANVETKDIQLQKFSKKIPNKFSEELKKFFLQKFKKSQKKFSGPLGAGAP